MSASVAPALSDVGLAFEDVLADDGGRLRAWTNDAEGVLAGPTVVLCNGLGTNPWAWPAFLQPDCEVRVVSWNHRGTGGSDRPADPDRVGVEEMMQDALSVMDHFGVDRAVLMGWSIGVNTIFELAARHPERVRGLFAVAGVPGDSFSTMLGPFRVPRRAARGLTVNLSRALKLGGRLVSPVSSRLPVGARAVAALSHSGLMFPVAYPELTARAISEFLDTPVDWYFHMAMKAAEHPRVSLRDIAVPVELVAGTFDVMAGARHMATAAARLPDATYVELRGTHFLQMEQPQRVHDLLRGFLDRVG